MVDITLLGTAALMPIPERALTAVTLTCSGHTILFDCGEGTQTAARKAGVSLMKADIIALTHYHGDHIFGLPGLMQTMSCMNRTETLYITGPKGLAEAMAPILLMTGRTEYPVVLIELPEEGAELGTIVPGWPKGAKLTPFPTEHRVPSQGYRFALERAGRFIPEKAKALGIPMKQWKRLQCGNSIETENGTVLPEQVMGAPRKGISVVFSGDTMLCDSLIENARNVDLMICEGTYGEDDQGEAAAEYGHMNFANAAKAAAAANARELWLTHYSQVVEEPEKYLPNAKRYFENTVCGIDGMRTTLRFEN